MNNTPSEFRRLASMLVDHIFMSFILAIPGFMLVSDEMTNAPSLSAYPLKISIGFGIMMGVYMCKDSFNGRSFGKRNLKYQIIYREYPASPLRCVVRNFTTIIWPIEVIITFFSPQKRIGDLLAGTKTVYAPTPLTGPINYSKIGLALIIGSVYSIGIFKVVEQIL